MSKNRYTVAVVVSVTLLCSACSGGRFVSAHVQARDKACFTFAVMPFYYPSNYPYSLDQLRESFLNAFAARGLDRDYWERNWAELDTMNISLVNLNEEQADAVAKLLKVDLLITGELRNNVKFRETWNTRIFPNTMLVKAYHARSHRFVLREAPNDIGYWGLMPDVKDGDRQAKDFVDHLVSMGFVQ